MPKDISGGVPISKNQRTIAAKRAKAAKLGLVKKHGGTCSSCGQVSTSCTPGSFHDGCKGYFQGDFGYRALNLLAEQTQSPMLYDGSPIQRPQPGKWLSAEEMEPINVRRSERDLEAYNILRNQRHIIPIVADGKTTGVKFENGMGETLVWVDSKWTREKDLPAYTNDPIPPELVNVTEPEPEDSQAPALLPSEDPEQPLAA